MISLGLGLQNSNRPLEGEFSLTDISGLQLWLKNDTGITTDSKAAVSQWDDQSGNSNHAVQATGSRRPIYGSGDVDFDGTDDRLDLTSQIPLEAFSVFIVIDPDVTTSMGVMGSASNQCFRVTQGGDVDRVTIKGTAGDSDQLNLTQDLPTIKYLLSVTRNAPVSTDNVRVFVGTTDVTDVTRDSMNPVRLTVNTVGSCTGAFLPFNGLINEVAVYDTLLTSNEITSVQNDLIARNSIS